MLNFLIKRVFFFFSIKDHFQPLAILLGFYCNVVYFLIFLQFCPRVQQYVWPAVKCMVNFSSCFLPQIIKQLYPKSNLEEKTLSLYGYHHDYAVLHMHTKNDLLLILFFLTFASVALKVSIKSVVLSLLVGCL